MYRSSLFAAENMIKNQAKQLESLRIEKESLEEEIRLRDVPMFWKAVIVVFYLSLMGLVLAAGNELRNMPTETKTKTVFIIAGPAEIHPIEEETTNDPQEHFLTFIP